MIVDYKYDYVPLGTTIGQLEDAYNRYINSKPKTQNTKPGLGSTGGTENLDERLHKSSQPNKMRLQSQ